MAEELLEDLSQEVTCATCLEPFDDPRTLKCGHTFCFSCLAKMVKNFLYISKIECPLCREVHTLDRKGVDGLNKNRYLANIAEKLRKRDQLKNSALPKEQGMAQQPSVFSSYASVPSSTLPAASPMIPPPTPISSLPTSNLPPTVSSPPLTSYSSNPPTAYSSPQSYYSPTAPGYFPAPSAPPLDQTPQPVPSAYYPASYPQNTAPYPASTAPVTYPMPGYAVPPQTGLYPQLIQPSYVSFSINPTSVQRIILDWMRGLWFPPSDLLQLATFGPIELVLVPYWAFDATCQVNYSLKAGHIVHNETKYTPQSGSFVASHHDLLVCADIQKERAEFLPFLKNLQGEFKIQVTSSAPQPGIPVDATGEAEIAWKVAHSNIQATEQKVITERIKKEQKTEDVKNLKTDLVILTRQQKLVYLPVFFTYFMYSDKKYILVVSGQNGAVSGQRPWGMGKVGEIAKSGADFLTGILWGKK